MARVGHRADRLLNPLVTTAAREERTYAPVVVAAAATVLAAVLGVVRIGSKSLWYDEGVTLGLAQAPFHTMWFRITHHEVNQSPYHLLFSFWYRDGMTAGTMRLLSVAFAAATVPVVYLLGRRLFDARVGAVAAVLVASNGLVIRWSQQLRAYTMVLFLVSLATLLFLRATDRSSPDRWAAYVVVAVAAVLAHFFAALVLLVHAVSLLLLRPRSRGVLAAAAAIAVLLAPVAWFVLDRQNDPLAWATEPTPVGLGMRLGTLAGGSWLQLVVIGAAVALGAWRVIRAARDAGSASAVAQPLLPVLWLALPLSLILVCTYTAKPLFEPRFLIVVVPAIALLAAAGAVRIADRRAGVAAVAVLVAVSLAGVVSWYRAAAEEDWRGATAALLAELEPGDSVVAVPAQTRPIVGYYGRRDAVPVRPLVPSSTSPIGGPRLWEIARTPPVLSAFDLLPTYPEWRDAQYRLAEERRFTKVTVRLYVRR